MRRFAVVCLLALSACGGGSDKATSPGGNNGGSNNGGGNGSTSNQISVGDNFFDPPSTTLAPGTTVTWTWNGSGSVGHNVTFDNSAIGNSTTQTSGTFQKTFNTAGTFNYHCTVHGTGMSGTIVIQ
jgi:plastocyanin